MAWQDFTGFLQQLRSNPVAAPQKATDYNTLPLGQATGMSFGASPIQAPSAPKSTMPPIAQGQIGLPFSGDQFPAPAPLTGPESPSTAATNAFGDLYHNVNLGNVVPYMMERFPVVADEFAQQLTGGTGNGLFGIQTPLGPLNLNPLDAFLGGVKAISDVVGPVMDFEPNLQRDAALNQRVDTYRQLAGGPSPLSLPTLLRSMGQLIPGFGGTNLAATIVQGKGGVDLPDDLKAALDANPNMSQADVDKMLDQSGRQWSYMQGAPGVVTNLGQSLQSYAPELIAGGGAFGAAKGALGLTKGVAATSSLARFAPAISKVATAAGAIQKASLAMGTVTTAITTALDFKARIEGNQAALDYWDKLNATTPISNDPNVQLVTAFTTNPFTPAVKMLSGVRVPDTVPVFGGRTMGVIPLAKGLGNIYIDQRLGQTIASFTRDESKAIRYGAAMYNVPPEVMASHIGPGGWYENIATLNDDILNQAIKAAFRSLPETDQAVFLKLHPGQSVERDQALMTQIAPQIKNMLDNSRAIADAFQTHHWEYADMTGAFNPDTMAAMAKGYRNASIRTYDFRQATNTSLGYPNALHPDASLAVRSALDEVAGDTVTNAWLNNMKVEYGALRNIGTDLVTPQMVAADAIPKDVVSQIIDRGDQKYAQALTHNPIMARSGQDPVLYGDRSRPADYADALGTTPQVYQDAIGIPTSVKDWDGLRKFVTEKYAAPKSVSFMEAAHPTFLTPEQIAAKSNEDVWQLANKYVGDTIDPWVKAGARVDEATKTYQQLAPQLAQAQAAGDAAGVELLQKQMANLMEDVRLARDPVVPFTQKVSDIARESGQSTRDLQMTQAAMRKVDAMTRLDQLAAINREAAARSELGASALDMIRLNRDGDWAWVGKAPPVSDALYSHLAKFIDANPGLARMVYKFDRLSSMGDAQLWDMIRAFTNDRASSEKFLKGLTGNSRKALTNRLASVGPQGSSEDLAALMNSNVAQTGERGLTGEEAVAQMGRLKEARDEILNGQTPSQVQRPSNLKVPQSYVDSAQSDIAQGVFYDPEFLVYTHPQNIETLQNLIASGNVTKDAVLTILERDPVLMRGLEKLAASREAELGLVPGSLGLDKYLTDMVNGTSVVPGIGPTGVHSLDALIPKDFVPPTRGVIEVQSALDDAILKGDDTAIAAAIADPGPVPPMEGVPLEQARKAVGAQRYTSDVAKRLKAAGVGADSPIDPAVWGTSASDVSAVRQTEPVRVGPDIPEGYTTNPTKVIGGYGYPRTLRREGIYHVTTASDAVDRVGLKSIDQLGIKTEDVMTGREIDAGGFGSKGDTNMIGRIAVSFDRRVAETMKDRMLLASRAARGDLSLAQLRDHFEPLYREAYGAKWEAEMADALGTGDVTAPRDIYVRLQRLSGGMGGGQGTGLKLTFEQAAKLDPAQIAIKELAVRDSGALDLRPGKDAGQGEFDLPVADVWVKGERPPVAPPKPVSSVGADALSAILWGRTGMPPVTVNGVLTALREIESGRASTLGLGDGILAEAQTTGQKVLNTYLGKVEHGEFPPGAFMQGLNPAAMGDEIAQFARDMIGKGVVHLDPMLGVAYGLKKMAGKELYTSILSVPGAAEEFMSGYWASYEDRIAQSQLGQALHSFFGHRPNAQIRAEGKARFTQSIIGAGGDAPLADAIWNKWRDYHEQSQEPSLVRTLRGREYRPGDNAYFADIRNIPNNRLNALVTGFQKDEGVLKPYYDAKGVDVPETLRNADFSTMFREASSFTRRNLKNLPLGEQLAGVYGAVAHSTAVTTLYYQFRFGLDARFHMMQRFEPMFLYNGMAGLLPDEGPTLFAMNRDAIAKVSEDAMANTGYPFMGNRADYVYKAMRKLEKPALRNEITALDIADPKYHDALQGIVKEMAQTDSELSQTIAKFGDTPDSYLRAMDDWYGKVLRSDNPEGLVADVTAEAALRDPIMGEIYGRLEQVQRQTLADIRKVIYGNPERSVFERLMNNYLLFWPISYTFKAAKWEMKVLFDSVGGLPTGAGGAYLFNQAYSAHLKAMKDDPAYANLIASNQTLLFVAQMMFPLNPTDPLSWSLSPVVKDAFFGGTKQLADIGPVYTYTHLLPQATTELYKQTSDLPVWGQVYPMVTGYKEPTWTDSAGVVHKGTKPKLYQGPADQPPEPLDTSQRFGQ